MLETALEILRYIAIVIAAASAIWGLLHKLFAEDADGRRRLTRAGRIALSLMVAGAAVGVGSLWVQTRLAMQSRSSADREARLAAPLTQLQVRLTFANAELRRADAEPCSEFDLRPHGARFETFYPTLSAAPPRSSPSRSVVLVLPLDQPSHDASSAATRAQNEAPVHVLPLGVVALAAADNADALPAPMRSDQLLAMSATIEFREELARCEDRADHLYPRRIERPRKCNVVAEASRENQAITLTWHLDTQCIANGVDSADPDARATARLPERMMFFVLTDIDTLPFDPSNFAQSDAALPWDFAKALAHSPHTAHLELVPNGDETLAAEYDVSLQGTKPMAGKSGGGEVKFDYPIMSIWAGARKDA